MGSSEEELRDHNATRARISNVWSLNNERQRDQPAQHECGDAIDTCIPSKNEPAANDGLTVGTLA